MAATKSEESDTGRGGGGSPFILPDSQAWGWLGMGTKGCCELVKTGRAVLVGHLQRETHGCTLL